MIRSFAFPKGRDFLPAAASRPRTFRLDIARCVFCGRCAEAARGAVELTRDFELAARRREDLVIEVVEVRRGRRLRTGPARTGSCRAARRQGA